MGCVGIARADAFCKIAFCVILPTASHGAGPLAAGGRGGSVAEDDIARTGIRVGGWLPTPDESADAPERPTGPRRLPGDTDPGVSRPVTPPGRRAVDPIAAAASTAVAPIAATISVGSLIR